MVKLTIQKWGNSQGIRIPKYILDDTNLNIGDVLDCKLRESEIILKAIKGKKRRSKYKLKDLLNEIPDSFKCKEYNWGQDCGKEKLK